MYPVGEMQPLLLQLSVKTQLRRENGLVQEKAACSWTQLARVISTSEETNEEKHEGGEGNLQLMPVRW